MILVTLFASYLHSLCLLINFESNCGSSLNLSNIEQISSICYYSLAGLAILVGGLWAYYKYVKNRLFKQRISVENSYVVHKNEEARVLHYFLHVKNIGSTRVRIKSVQFRVLNVLPLSGCVRDAYKDGRNPIREDRAEYTWDEIDYCEVNFTNSKCIIEPDESDHFVYDYIFSKDDVTDVIQLYTNVKLWKEITVTETTEYVDLRKH